MSAAKLIRWSGPPTMLAGVLLFLFPLLHPNHDAAGFTGTAWVPVHLMPNVAALLLLFGLTGLYARQIERGGWFGLISYLLAFVGTASLLTGAMIELFIMPFFGLQSPDLVEAPPPPGIEEAFLLVNTLMAVGYLLFGVSIVRAGVWPRAAGLMLAIGGPLFGLGWRLTLMLLGVESELPSTLGDVLLSTSLIWLGYALWSDPAEGRSTRGASPTTPLTVRA